MRDGTSNYFLNGARCRRKDITQLFLGTGLGSRSYAIIEQGMISRVIEAKADDMRAFVEEAAGISTYKERRKETEARISDTRENLERLQDVRDEVDKQIRHLQRQAATARRYQALKETERRLTAELLALRLREIDSGAEVQDSAVRECELTMQKRAGRSARRRGRHRDAARLSERAVRARELRCRARYYEVGAEISRAEQSITHMRELREQQRNELAQARATLAELESHISRDEREIAALRAEIEKLAPDLVQAQAAESALAEDLAAAEQALADWQQRWEGFNREQGAAHQTTQVERARIEQLENQLRRLAGQADRLAVEREALDGAGVLGVAGRSSRKRNRWRAAARMSCRRRSICALDRSQKLRAAQFDAEEESRARAHRSREAPCRSGFTRGAAEGGASARRFAHRRVAGVFRSWQASAARRAVVGERRLGTSRRNGARRLSRSAVCG